MKRYEIIQEVFLPCSGGLVQDRRTIEERTLVSPERYVRGLYRDERRASYLHSTRDGSAIYEVVFDAGGKHRYTFTELP